MNTHFAELAKKEAAFSDQEEPPGRSRPSSSQDADATPNSSIVDTMVAAVKSIFSNKHDSTLKEAIEEMLEEHEDAEGEIPSEEKTILQNVLEFSDTTVGEIMTRRADIVAVPHDISLDDLTAHIIEQRHTRIPVYKGTLDHVEGFLHIKDLLDVFAGNKNFDIASALRPMLFVPPSMPIIDLLVKMRRLSSHMAIVVDEYGGTDGVVTLEDLFEEIVGDIQDEHDEEEHNRQFVRISAHVVEVDARITIETLESELNLQLSSQDEQDEAEYETLGGLIFFTLGRVPAKDEIVEHPSGLQFEIIDADMRRINKVRIHQVP